VIGVVVVDDDFMVARIHRSYVEKLPGFRVLGEAQTADSALTTVRALRPDLVLLDIYLPDRSGLEVLRELRASSDVAPDVLVITAARDVDTVRAAMHGGVVSYLVKPFTFATFRDRLERYAEGRRNLARSGELQQDDVDRAFELVRRGTPPPLPKGLSTATCALVVEALQNAGADLSAVETAERVGISRVSARRYLEHLTSTGQVTQRPRYGSAGRPEHRYAWVGR
jgi:two-component system CitB family response regulator